MTAHAGLCILARVAGFDHVSDDDFARVTIAQAFAVHPRLNPTGTSWLPFPFWTLGAGLAAFGRGLDTARALAIGGASLAAALPYVALRTGGTRRGAALVGTAFAFGAPWAIWLGAATVPESITASLTAAAAIGLRPTVPARHLARAGWGLAVAAACLSRYEAWPVAAVLAFAAGRATLRTGGPERRSWLAVVALCAAGPLLWMAWNAHAHDGPLHFFRRVSRFKRAIGEGATDPVEALLLYPRLLVTTRPEVTVPALMFLPRLRDPFIRGRWGLPLTCAAAQIAFLAYGNARDGAPAHHPERALLATTVLLGLLVGTANLTWLSARAARLAAACVALLWVATIARDAARSPGRTPDEDRSAQVGRGRQLRAAGATHLTITPCAYEHFALVAAYGAPENVAINAPDPAPPPSGCPRLEAR